MYIGSWKIDDLLTFTANTHTTAGAESDADSAPTYRVYEDETGTPILTGTMALLDDANTVGHYSEQITLSAANGFEKGKSYNIRIRGVVGGTAGATLRMLQIEAEVDANTASGNPPNLDATISSRASQTSVDDLPTNAELATSQASADDATLAAIAALSIPTAVQVRQEIDSNSTQLAAIVADTNELQTDWVNGGRLDLLIDAIKAAVDAILADTGTDGVALSAALCNKIADHVRRRTQANVEASSDGDTLDLSSEYGFIQQAQESAISGTTLTVKKTDGSTTLGTKTLTATEGADPITGIS